MHRSSLLSILAFLSGCTNANFFGESLPLQTQSLGLEKLVLLSNCPITASMPNEANEGELWLTDIPIDLLESGEFENGQIVRMQVLWLPTPGKTPLASTSTNVSIKQIIFSNGEIGVYAGAGFGWPSGSPEEGLSIYMEDATMVLLSSTSQFDDLLTPATMVGHIHARADTILARQISSYANAYLGESVH